MRPEELAKYAGEKYNMVLQERRNAYLDSYYTLNDPVTGGILAYLMKERDPLTGAETVRCDIKCGEEALSEFPRPYLSPPFRMYGKKWVGITFDERTEPEVVYKLVDRAAGPDGKYGWTFVLDPLPLHSDEADTTAPVLSAEDDDGLKLHFGGGYNDTELPFAADPRVAGKVSATERIWSMRRLYDHGRETPMLKAQNFCRQGKFMEDYEDDAPWDEEMFFCYYPTYHDMNTKQLRGYFAWRTRVRKGEYTRIALSAAYVYIYELLNGIGAKTPEESLEKVKAFETGFLDAGFGDARMRQYLNSWMYEFAVVNRLPRELTASLQGKDQARMDTGLTVLREPDQHTDAEVFDALCTFAGKKWRDSPVIAADKARGMHLFGEIWRNAAAHCRLEYNELLTETDLFTACFGEKRTTFWYPLSSAVFLEQGKFTNADYALNEFRVYRRRGGLWRMEAYDKANFKTARLRSFMRAADVRLRQYLKVGRPMELLPEESWIVPYIDDVIEADKKALREAARQKIRIDPAGLEKIRADATITLGRLLTEEEKLELTAPDAIGEQTSETSETADTAAKAGHGAGTEAAQAVAPEELPLDEIQLQIVRMLLHGEDAGAFIKARRLMPSMVADGVNEALFDEIGDNVILCDGDDLSLAEDYIEDIERLLGGQING